MTSQEAHEALRFTDSYSRMGTLMELASQMKVKPWLRLLGKNWMICDNIADYSDDLYVNIDRIDGPTAEMMTPAERKALAALPDVITVYRGGSLHNICGWSWSLDAEVAKGFPTLNRYRVANPSLLLARY